MKVARGVGNCWAARFLKQCCPNSLDGTQLCDTDLIAVRSVHGVVLLGVTMMQIVFSVVSGVQQYVVSSKCVRKVCASHPQ